MKDTRTQKTKTKHKSHIKKHKPTGMVVNTTDDEMVVFPMSNKKLATTWMQNVDSILSEGTGKITLDRLQQMHDKLSNALTLVDSRLTEMELKKTEESANNVRKTLINSIPSFVGGTVRRTARNGQYEHYAIMLITSAQVDDAIRLRGLSPFANIPFDPKKPVNARQGVILVDITLPLDKLHVVNVKSRSNFSVSVDGNNAVYEFSNESDRSTEHLVREYTTEFMARLLDLSNKNDTKGNSKKVKHGRKYKRTK
jgi:hypothetical protein